MAPSTVLPTYKMFVYIILAVTAVAAARPSYIAVPADQIAFLDLNSLRRVPRQAQGPPTPAPPQPRVYEQEHFQPISIKIPRQLSPQEIPITIPQIQTSSQPQRVVTLQQLPQQQPKATTVAQVLSPSNRYERPPDFGEYIDFGAHTGDSGAFGWYADYPLNNREDTSAYEIA